MHNFLTILRTLTQHTDRHTKGHAIALLKRLQDINPQDND
jgi:hypothetical protein